MNYLYTINKKNSYLTFSYSKQGRIITVEKAAFFDNHQRDEILSELGHYIYKLDAMELRCRSYFPLSFVKELDASFTLDGIDD